MANLVYKRVSTDQQSTARQDLVLAEAGIEDPVGRKVRRECENRMGMLKLRP
ncbi:hypothetical protein ACIPRL_29565 [Streptomyces sp. NPDC090085]|uniref:hypothetical protein n=1 Tax=Streptomyces sp. NPDC090085 TaxID=3365943 RepID=UPI003828F72F